MHHTKCEALKWQNLTCMLSHFSCVQLFAIPWTVAWQAPLFIDFCRQEYWSEWPCPPPEYLPNPGIELVSLTHPALAGGFFATSATWEAPKMVVLMLSHVQLFVTPWTVAQQAPLSKGFSRQEYWSGLPTPGDLPDPRIEPTSPAASALAGGSLPLSHLGSPQQNLNEAENRIL